MLIFPKKFANMQLLVLRLTLEGALNSQMPSENPQRSWKELLQSIFECGKGRDQGLSSGKQPWGGGMDDKVTQLALFEAIDEAKSSEICSYLWMLRCSSPTNRCAQKCTYCCWSVLVLYPCSACIFVYKMQQSPVASFQRKWNLVKCCALGKSQQ